MVEQVHQCRTDDDTRAASGREAESALVPSGIRRPRQTHKCFVAKKMARKTRPLTMVEQMIGSRTPIKEPMRRTLRMFKSAG